MKNTIAHRILEIQKQLISDRKQFNNTILKEHAKKVSLAQSKFENKKEQLEEEIKGLRCMN